MMMMTLFVRRSLREKFSRFQASVLRCFVYSNDAEIYSIKCFAQHYIFFFTSKRICVSFCPSRCSYTKEKLTNCRGLALMVVMLRKN